MPKCRLAIALFFLCFSSSFLFGKIIQIDTIERFESEAQEIDRNCLILFDVDCTLIMPQDAILGPQGKEYSYQLIAEMSTNPEFYQRHTLGELHGRVLQTAPFAMVEKETLSLVQKLQTHEIPVMALTAAEARRIGEIESFVDFRINQLKEFGFDFSHTFPMTDFLQFAKSENKEFYPVFKAGVLFSSDHPKGDVLKQFLSELQVVPKKIVFIDDRMDYVQSVEKAAEELKIEFIGLHYTAADKLSKPIDEKLAEFQFKHLAEHGKWLNDGQAKEHLKIY